MSIEHDEHFFRHQYANLVATLSRKVGVQHLAAIEDAVQTSLLKAWDLWKTQLPANPEAWLHRVAYNALMDSFRKDKLNVPLDWSDVDTNNVCEKSINSEGNSGSLERVHRDEDLIHLIFVCCDTAIPHTSSLVLVLKVLCGFSVKEIAMRLFISEANVHKRYQRARNELKKRSGYFNTLPVEDSSERLDAVLKVLYLLFSEGYLSYSPDQAIREDLCEEAIRLATILLQKPRFPSPVLAALLALMYFNLSRLSSRQGECNELLLLEEQDRSLWDKSLIARGFKFFAESAEGDSLTRYHLEAAIAAEHCRAASFAMTNWQAICNHYQTLESIAPSYLYRLNRAVALAEWQGPEAGLALLQEQTPPTWAAHSYLWLSVAADLHRRCGHREEAGHFTQLAIECSPNKSIKVLVKKRLNSG